MSFFFFQGSKLTLSMIFFRRLWVVILVLVSIFESWRLKPSCTSQASQVYHLRSGLKVPHPNATTSDLHLHLRGANPLFPISENASKRQCISYPLLNQPTQQPRIRYRPSPTSPLLFSTYPNHHFPFISIRIGILSQHLHEPKIEKRYVGKDNPIETSLVLSISCTLVAGSLHSAPILTTITTITTIKIIGLENTNSKWRNIPSQ